MMFDKLIEAKLAQALDPNARIQAEATTKFVESLIETQENETTKMKAETFDMLSQRYMNLPAGTPDFIKEGYERLAKRVSPVV